MSELLRIENLSVDFISEGKSIPAVKNLSLSVKRSKLLAIVGESGSGKSVTALSILRLLPQPPAVYRSGSIALTEHEGATVDLLQASPSVLQTIRGARISMIFQEPMTSLNPVMRCGEQIMEALLAHKKISARNAKAITLGWLEKVKLPDPSGIFARYPHQLSGGQKQRVMIAMAMCCEPSLLICDEPTTALDVTVQKAILDLIRELQWQHQMGVIFITHDLAVVSQIADEVAIMYKGELVELKNAKDIFQSGMDFSTNTSFHPYTRALLSCRPALHAKGVPLPIVDDFMKTGEYKIVNRQSSIVNRESSIVNRESSMEQSSKVQKKLVSTEPMVKVENLVIRFPSKTNLFGKTLSYVTAVDHVSLEVFKGETLGLVGESGCGKTTLGRAVLRLVEADEGNIVYNGKNITKLSASEIKTFRKDVQLIFQDPYSSLNPRLTIGSALAEPMKVAHIVSSGAAQKSRVDALLEKVNLSPSMSGRYPHEFSGGQRQRIVIARALSLGPGFLVCDESVSALDVSVQAQVLNLLNDLKKELGLTMLFISHDLSVVRYMCDRIVVMQKGKIVESGTAEEVYYHPKTNYTQQLIAAVPNA